MISPTDYAECVDGSVRWIDGTDEARGFAQWVLDPTRTRPIVCLTATPYLSELPINPQATADLLGDKADVWALRGARESWALAEALPDRMDVYGGAARVWWPIADPDDVNPYDHPRFLTYGPDETVRVLRQIDAVLTPETAETPAEGTDTSGTVTGVYSAGAEIRLLGGHSAFVALKHLSAGEIFHAREAVKIGQDVQVRISSVPPDGSRGRILVSLLPFAPIPWARIAEVYSEGMVVEGVVAQLRDYGAMVDLMPGVWGLLTSQKISETYVNHPSEHLEVDDSVLVKILSWEPEERRAWLSIVDVPADAAVEPVASIYPSGPPWLAPPDRPAPTATPDATQGGTRTPASAPDTSSERVAVDTPEEAAGDRPPAPENAAGNTEIHAQASSQAADIPEPATSTPEIAEGGRGETAPASAPAPRAPLPVGGLAVGDLVKLRSAIEAGQNVREDLGEIQRDAERQLATLRATARGLVSELRDEITAASSHISNLSDGQQSALESAEETVAALRQQVDELREHLRVTQAERTDLIRGQSRLRERLESSRKSITQERARAEHALESNEELRGQLDAVDDGDEERRFLREMRHMWSKLNTLKADRERYPFREPTLGPKFLASVDSIEGITLARILEVCAQVVSGRAYEIAGLELHQLRASKGGDSGQRIRPTDGAIGWRVSLQVKSHSARRLHYWQLRDGTIEFSKVGTHDDLTIV